MGMIYLRGTGGDAIALGGTRVPAAELAMLKTADRVLREAVGAADEIGREAREQADRARREGNEKGRLEGREAALIEILGTLDVEWRMRDVLAERIGHVVEQCMRSLIGDIGSADLFRQRVRHAVRTLVPDGQATLHVAPGQAHVAKAMLRDLEEESGSDLRWLTVHVDEGRLPDEFVIETAAGFVDARIATTLADARRIVEDAIRRAGEQWTQRC